LRSARKRLESKKRHEIMVLNYSTSVGNGERAMNRIGGVIGAVGLMAALASPGWAADGAAAKPPASKGTTAKPATAVRPTEGPAVSTGERSMGADELARAGRQVGATPATTIYQATLKDGTFELSDRPPEGGATGIERRSYALPQDATARQRAEAERDYWSRQAEAFERRRTDRDRVLEQAQRGRPAPPTIIVHTDGRRGVYHGYGWVPPDLYGAGSAPGAVVVGGFAPVYTSSPGAVQGRDAGFIGSGFGVRR
jgi:hypothetical protein